MNAKPLTVVMLVKAKPGKESQVRHEMLALVDPSLKDTGCLNFDLHQALDNPALFLFHENWTSESYLEQHLQKPNVKEALARLEQAVAEPTQITLWKKIG